MEKKQFLDWNENMFVKYNNLRMYNHPNPIIRYTENKRVRKILSGVKGYEKIVEIGCGEGYILHKIKAREIVGLDISETALKRAYQLDNSKILVRADAEELPFSDSYFDAAICSETIEHTVHPDKVISELSRVVKPGGRIIVTIPNEPLINSVKDAVEKIGAYKILFPNVPKRQNEEWHLHSFDLNLLKKVIGQKLVVERITCSPTRLLPIRYIAICKNDKAGSSGVSKEMFRVPYKKINEYLDFISS